MAIHFTPEQQKVLDARDHNILVSAAAGSGKTAVLVERIVRLCSEGEEPLDIDRLLVVTYTRAAAAQMRERISQAFSARLAEDPSNKHLQAQGVLLHNARITTMDSFFTFLLRNYFSDIDLDPGFRQIDPAESDLIAADVMKDFLEEKYAEKDQAFLRCVEYFCSGTDDRQLEDLIRELCSRAGSHPSPAAWLMDRAGDYDIPDEEALFAAPWMHSLILRTVDMLLEADSQYEAMEAICREPGGPDPVLAFLQEEQEGLFGHLRTLCRDEKNGTADLRSLWEAVRRALSRPFSRYPAIRGKKYEYIEKDLKNAVKSMRDAQKDRIQKMRTAIGDQSTEMILASMAAAREPVQTLSALAVDFLNRFSEVKKDRHLIDFVDLEHFALDILAKRQEDGSYVPRRAAKDLRSHYAEILIDEYQDSNEVQELLLQIISGEDDGRNNRFMVGDIKQSIYRFRLARPEIFMEKYGTYREGDPERELIELDRNFRSRAQVLDYVNALFLRIMRREIGGVEYSQRVSLKNGAVFQEEDRSSHDPYEGEDRASQDSYQGEEPPSHDPAQASVYTAELLLLSTGAPETDGTPAGQPEDADGAGDEAEDGIAVLSEEIGAFTDRQKEALLIANRIRQMVGKLPVQDEDTNEMRPVRYGDIVVLLRTAAGWNEDLRAVFAREGIPAYAESRTGYFAAEEIRVILQMLRVLDNPRQDIPLYGAMRGFFGNFTPDEIAAIRLTKRDGMLYDALCAAAETVIPPALGTKCRDFLDMLQHWRLRAQYTTVSGIITALMEESGYVDYCAALPAGSQRIANLRILCTQAEAFTRTDYTGLFQFLRYIDGLKKQEIDLGEANILDENADVVRIMTIHKSKGLEFPVCFVAGLSGAFSFRRHDASGPMLFDSDWGVGIHYYDPVSRVRATTLRREEIAEKIRRDCMGEELRVLYVALTRAKEKLIMTAAAKDFPARFETWRTKMAGFLQQEKTDKPGTCRKLSASLICEASSFAELICEAFFAQPSMPVTIRQFSREDLTMHAVSEQMDLSRLEERLKGLEGRSLAGQPDPGAAQKLADSFFRAYPHEELRGLYAQTSVSELKHRAMQEAAPDQLEDGAETAVELFPEKVPVPYIPAFIRQEDITADGARRGTAFHRILELMDYSRLEELSGRAPGMEPGGTEQGTEEGTKEDSASVHGNAYGGAMKDPMSALKEWIHTVIQTGRITKEDAGLVSLRSLQTFLQSPLAARMAAAEKRGELFREQPFVLGCPADRLSEGFPHSETVTVQGIIDAFFLEGDRIVLVDYKTDRVETEQELRDRYGTQLALYAEALEKGFGLAVTERIIYSTAFGREILLDLCREGHA
ncbi:MAG: UvrD-helicase domain-containing protein [Eubacteriales bacterium]|nr:UvrD-helicase domain-containing protein [Eubacteriales bacterium]